MEAIKVEDFSCYYKLDKGGYVTALDKVSFCVESGEMLTVIGESGGGKTSLLRCMLGLNDYTSGTLLMGGVPADSLDVADNNMAYVRQEIVLYPMSVISAHVSDVPNAHTSRSCPMKTRADIASIAVFGYETGFVNVTQEEKDDVRKYVRRYNEIYDLVLTGDLYRLKNPFESNYFAKLILSKEKDRGFFVYYRRQFTLSLPQDRLYLQGLDPDATYNIPELDITAKGRTLMEFGLCIGLEWHDFDSILCHINKV